MATSVEERERVVAAYRASGRTQVQFAEQAGIKVETLRAWIYRGPTKQAPQERRRAARSAFVEVRAASAPAVGTGVELRIGGLVVRSSAWPPAEWVALVLAKVGA